MTDWLTHAAAVVFALLPASKAVAAAAKLGVDLAGTAVFVYLFRTPFRYTLILVSGAVAAIVSLGLGLLCWAAASQAPEIWAEVREDVGTFSVLIWAPTALFAMLARFQDARGGPRAGGGASDDVRRARRELGYDD